MPRRAIKKWTKKKRSYGWKRKPYASRRTGKKKYSVRVRKSLFDNMNIPGISNGKKVRMKYVTAGVAMTSTTGAQQIYTHTVNNIYDPNVTGGGHQPYGHDEFATYYNQYQVLGCKVTTSARWSAPPAATDVPTVIFSFMDSDTTAPTTLATKMERYARMYKILKPDTTSTVSFTDYWSAKKWFKMKDVADQHQTIATFGNAPVKTAYHQTITQPLDESSTTTTPIIVTVTIDYIVRLLDPKPILGS